MVSDRKLANAVGGRSARACDNCVKKRARWYCAADDAFLCQSCDLSVHSANPLARRHERVRLKTASSSSNESFDDEDGRKPKLEISVPSWDQGFTRKARTPRQKKPGKFNPLHLVPEMCSEEQSVEENEVQLLYRVPIFDPFEFSVNPVRNDEDEEEEDNNNGVVNDEYKTGSCFSPRLEGINIACELDLEEFAADVESLLGKGLEDESFDMEELGLLDCSNYEKESRDCSLMVKVEDEEIGVHGNCRIDENFDLGRETFELNLDFGSCEEEEEEEEVEKKAEIQEVKGDIGDYCNKTFLKLDYEGVMSAWDIQKSPWITGDRPEFNFGDGWPQCLGTSGAMHAYGVESGQAWAGRGDGGREARVMRYREKRRTRLFSKKIRYEVRKLNAEKRPRMKGRFVKRASFAASAFPLLSK